MPVVLLALMLLSLPVVAQDQQFADLGSCALESGERIEACRIGYRTFGALSEARDNAILIPTWFSGTSEAWVELQAQLLGAEHDHFVIVVDALANGVSVSPSNSRAQAGAAFPEITTRDMVRSQYRLLREVLELDRLHAVMGVSMGGMQAFEWGVLYPGFMRKLIPIAGSPKLAAYDVALWETYKALLELGEACRCARAARAIRGLFFLTGASPRLRNATVEPGAVPERIRSATAEQFGTGRSLDLIRQADAMIATDVSRAFSGAWRAAAAAVQARALVIVSSSDHVVTPGAATRFAELLGERSTLIEFANDCGHGIPACEMFRSRALIREFLRGA